METIYYLGITYPHNWRKIHMMESGEGKTVVAFEGQQQLLLSMGDELMKAGLIGSYQLLQAVGMPVKSEAVQTEVRKAKDHGLVS